jgi:hypothetical protein
MINICSSSGSISIGTNSNTTSITSRSNIVYSRGGSIKFTNAKSKYHVLGEDVEIDEYYDSYLAIAISTLNVLGRPFYEELIKQDIYISDELKKIIEKNLKILDRENKINQIIK